MGSFCNGNESSDASESFACVTFSVPKLRRAANRRTTPRELPRPLLLMEALHALPGVCHIGVDVRLGCVTVGYDPPRVAVADLWRVLDRAGYAPSVYRAIPAGPPR
ncbi:MAG: heavy-metal-associated domain-containing protein [Chloroflexi bacterium]|nr:heavy-metal-associated domain-containing protein [Chloroflexota bacterium]